MVRLILTYVAETRPNKFKTQMMQTVETRVVQIIHGNTLHDRIRTGELREKRKLEDVGIWFKHKRMYWSRRNSS